MVYHEDRLLQRARLGHRLEAELVIWHAPAVDVRVDGAVSRPSVWSARIRGDGGLMEAVAGGAPHRIAERASASKGESAGSAAATSIASTFPLS